MRIGYVDGELIVNPTIRQLEKSDLDLRVAGSEEAIIMVEAGAKRSPSRDGGRAGAWPTSPSGMSSACRRRCARPSEAEARYIVSEMPGGAGGAASRKLIEGSWSNSGEEALKGRALEALSAEEEVQDGPRGRR